MPVVAMNGGSADGKRGMRQDGAGVPVRASPGTTHTFDIIPGYGLVPVTWPATGRELDAYRVDRISASGYRYRVLPGHHVLGALEWHARAVVSFAVGERVTRAQRIRAKVRLRTRRY